MFFFSLKWWIRGWKNCSCQNHFELHCQSEYQFKRNRSYQNTTSFFESSSWRSSFFLFSCKTYSHFRIYWMFVVSHCSFWKCKNPEKWQLQSFWKIHGDSLPPKRCSYWRHCSKLYGLFLFLTSTDHFVSLKYWLWVGYRFVGKVSCGSVCSRRTKFPHLLSNVGWNVWQWTQ